MVGVNMKVFLADNQRIKDYFLPTKVEDEFVINYVSSTGIEETLALSASNNSWIISSGVDKTVYKGVAQIKQEALQDNAVYRIKFNDLNDFVTLYCFDTPMKYYDFDIGTRRSIELGNSNTSDIFYNSPLTFTKHIIIHNENGNWIVELATSDPNAMFYINNERAYKKVLRMGDLIFVNGLKIIWMNQYIRINNPNNKVSTRLEVHKQYSAGENTYTPPADTEKNIVLYNDNQVFFHTPRITKSIPVEKISIEKPPEKRENEEQPMILTYGATILMGISSTLTGVLAVFSLINGKGEANIANVIVEIMVCLSMLLGSILFPIISDRVRKRQIKKRERNIILIE